MSELHPNLPPHLPPRIARLPVDARGYPVPWFVQWFKKEIGEAMERTIPCDPGDPAGWPDFRVVDSRKRDQAMAYKRCWVCGERLGAYLAFVIGPMCAINRVSGEPPSHMECAIFSAKACPFLTKPKVVRREAGLPEASARGTASIDRNPGVALVWVTREYDWFAAGEAASGGILYRVGPPTDVFWYREGRPATRQEVLESINSGLPILVEAAEQDGKAALMQLAKMHQAALQLLPAEATPVPT